MSTKREREAVGFRPTDDDRRLMRKAEEKRTRRREQNLKTGGVKKHDPSEHEEERG